jgi:hypothetical protein
MGFPLQSAVGRRFDGAGAFWRIRGFGFASILRRGFFTANTRLFAIAREMPVASWPR